MFEGAGVPRAQAKQVMDLLVESNLVGHDSHGIMQIPRYVDDILEGRTKPRARIEIVRESPTTALVDAHWGLGQVVARRTMSLAIAKAEKHGVGIVSTFNCAHIGRMADYILMAAARDMMGICLTNHDPGVAPFGGRERIFNQSPIGWAVPAGKEPPFMLDISTSVSAAGKISVARAQGKKVAPGYIIDGEGNPSVDPEDYFKGGACLPLGGPVGYKGTGLAMAVDICAGLLSGRGAAYLSGDRGQGVFQMAIKIAAFRDLSEFKEEMDNLIRRLRGSKPAPGFKEVLAPGDLELRTKKVREKTGIDIPEATWREIVQTARKLKVDVGLATG